MGEKELMEDKEKEIEKLCKKAESLVIRYKRGDIPMKSYSPYQTTSYGYKSPDEQQREWVRKNVDEAEKLIKKALTLSEKKSAEALRLQGYVNYLQKNDYSVMSNYEKAYKIEPDNWKLLYNIALYYYYCKKTDLEKACEYIIKAVEINSSNKDLWHFLSDLFFRKLAKMPGFLPTVLKYHLKFLESFPNDDKALRKMGEIYYKQNNFVEVIKHYKTFTERNSKDFYELKLLGDAYREIGDIDNAIIAYEKCVKNDPNLNEIKKFLFEQYSLQGYNLTNEEEVVDFIKNREVKERKARTLCKNKEFPKAIELLQKYLESNPRSTTYLSGLGSLYRIMNDPQKALEYFIKTLESNPLIEYRPYVNIPLIHAELGNFDAALAYLKIGLKIFEDNVHIENSLKKVYIAFNKPLDINQFKQELFI